MQKKLIAIVGAGPGVSAGVARRFGAEGFAVVLLARSAEALDERVSELRAAGIEAHSLVADVTDPESLRRAFATLESEYGTPDVLHYNAGAITVGTPLEVAADDVSHDFAVNVLGALECAQLVAPAMRERGSGTLLFTGGMLGVNPVASRVSAAIGKAGLRNLVFTLADELAGTGVTVGTVTIGGVVKAGTFFDPDAIAGSFWDLHTGAATGEVQFVES
ncbi:MAG: SDR family NAD(P)-dependent oxidoreductase [Arthrobacter sp.]|nr:SDR family NAD(P)-dependent oxidoreductase [Micrococcaceae bacterium]MDN5813595.1 SDR family NAD(P)-dependent oxidoreductase [Micrococcaceae bacterium]MDN5880484.1 SDR family NAD(P)-dependent oxidoreductase [Micrococcaceae bacterium]MDN5886071.1 SDR family NAD(P)-dependent oxidoreductase [Micrococcaceae bacterium]MDN5906274.1 SDR family NAD(P)-dependent oxidoreductase [Micrococcaceae bacterium]